MRKNKFRAWDKEFNRMVFQHDVNLALENKEYLFSLNEESVELLHYDEDYSAYVKCDAELMQYIGLKDKNGKEIYEGDIIKFMDEYECYTDCGYEYEEFENIGEIIWNEQSHAWDVTNRNVETEDVWHYSEYIEVIGNVYKNKDLLR